MDISQRLGLSKPTTTDPFSTSALAENWQTLDDSPGIFLCTDTTRPTDWGVAHEGMLIGEVNTDLYWRWTGSGWERAWGKGWLGGSRRTSDLGTNLTTPQTLVAATVIVPAGGRRVGISVSYPEMEATTGILRLYLLRGGAQIHAWKVQGDSDSPDAWEDGQGGGLTFFEAPGAGIHTYALAFSAISGIGGTATARGAIDSPISVDVVEH